MHSNQTDFIAALVSDCLKQGITDADQIIENISGQYIVDNAGFSSFADTITDNEPK